jgi:hypothetical protein
MPAWPANLCSGIQERGVVKRAITAAVLAVALLSEPANAHDRVRGDSDDTPSRLDIGSIGLGHYRRMVIVTMTTYGRWRPSELRRRANYITFEFDSRGGPGSDYYLYVDYSRGRLGAWLYKDNGQFIAQASVNKGVSPKALGAHFPGRLLRPDDYIRAYGQTAFKAPNYCRRTCFDVSPNQGWLAHKW